jgi:hypothetical protein
VLLVKAIVAVSAVVVPVVIAVAPAVVQTVPAVRDARNVIPVGRLGRGIDKVELL